jgi:hypothetical protein
MESCSNNAKNAGNIRRELLDTWRRAFSRFTPHLRHREISKWKSSKEASTSRLAFSSFKTNTNTFPGVTSHLLNTSPPGATILRAHNPFSRSMFNFPPHMETIFCRAGQIPPPARRQHSQILTLSYARAIPFLQSDSRT